MLREKQKKKIFEILNCNSTPLKESILNWKILIYDERGSSIISSVFENFFSSPNDDSKTNKNETSFEFGITYHALISDTKNRTRISDVPAIYFILPTKDNLEILINDIHKNLYDKFYINFISSIKNDDLRDFARRIATQNDGSSIAKISDSYLDFLSYEDGRFELFEGNQDSLFKGLYGLKQQLSDITIICDKITDKLLSILITNDQGVPIILSKGDLSKFCSDMLAEKIKNLLPNDDKSNSNSKTKNQPFGIVYSSQRPVLVLTDRSLDYLTMLYHCNTYDSLLDDIFGLKNDRNGFSIDNTYIDKSTDKFWNENKHKPIDVVFPLVNEFFKTYKQEYSSIDKNLTQAISNIQSIKASQDSLTAHTKLCEKVLSIVKSRRINEFYLAEVDTFSKPDFDFVMSGIDKNLIFNEDGSQKNTDKDDKIRLISVAYLSDTITNSSLSSIYGEISNFNFLTNVEYFKTFTKASNSNSNFGGSSEDFLTSFVGRFSAFKGRSFKYGVSRTNEQKSIDDSFAILSHMPISEYARKAVLGKYDEFQLNDPLKKSKIASEANLELNTFSSSSDFNDSPNLKKKNIIVFVLGGGNYSEFDGIYGVGLENEGKGVEITYGCTKMQRPIDFLHELMEL